MFVVTVSAHVQQWIAGQITEVHPLPGRRALPVSCHERISSWSDPDRKLLAGGGPEVVLDERFSIDRVRTSPAVPMARYRKVRVEKWCTACP